MRPLPQGSWAFREGIFHEGQGALQLFALLVLGLYSGEEMTAPSAPNVKRRFGIGVVFFFDKTFVGFSLLFGWSLLEIGWRPA